MDELKAMLRDVLENQRIQRREIDEIQSNVAAIAKALEQDDRLQDRLERAEAREREELAKDVDDVKQRVENLGVGLRDFPDRMLQHIEKKVYELRSARWEALQAGVQRDPTPAFGTVLPGYREQTGKIAVANPDSDELTLTPGQQRGLVKLVHTVWVHGKWHLLTVGAGGAVVGFWQKIVAIFKH